MKLSEIKTALESGKKLITLDINVKSYLPIVEKMMTILGYNDKDNIHQDGIIDDCIEFSNGIAYIDHFKKDISTLINIINWYTDIEIDETNLSDMTYDFIITSGIWEAVKDQIPDSEYKSFMNYLNISIEEELRKYNSIEAIISNNLTKVADKIPNDMQLKKLVKTLIKDVNGMDWDKVPMIKQMFETLQTKKIK